MLPVQGAQVQSLVGNDPVCCTAWPKRKAKTKTRVCVLLCAHTQTYTYFLKQGQMPRVSEPAAGSSKAGLPPVHVHTLSVQQSPSDLETRVRAPRPQRAPPCAPSDRSGRQARETCLLWARRSKSGLNLQFALQVLGRLPDLKTSF